MDIGFGIEVLLVETLWVVGLLLVALKLDIS